MTEAMKSEWAELDKMTEPLPAEELKTLDLERLALEYQVLTDQQKGIAANLKAIRERVGSLCDEEPGEYVVNAGKFDFHLRRGEKFEWDQSLLEPLWGIFKGTPDAALIDASFTIDKKKYQKLSAAEVAVVNPALTRKPGTMTCKVTLKGEGVADAD